MVTTLNSDAIYLRPYSFLFSIEKGSWVQILLGSFLIALTSQIRLPLPFSPIPLTLQTLSILLVGSFLGSRAGFISVALYLGQVLIGLPVLAGGVSDPLALIGPRAGYLIGFLFQAYAIGFFIEKCGIKDGGKLFFTGLMISSIQLLIGTLWLASFVGAKSALLIGFVPFIPGEVFKVFVLVNILQKNKSFKISK